MRSYELTYLVLPEKSEQDLKKIENDITTFIEKKGGVLEKKERPARRKMSPQIEKINSAFLETYIFQLNPMELKNLKKELKEKKEIFNFIVLNKKRQRKTLREKKMTTKKVKKTEPKVELAEIEKKLDEILGE